MKFIQYCEEPYFFMKIYNSISADKRYEFELKLRKFQETFEEYYDGKLFNPKISFKDSFIIIHQDKEMVTKIDLREELRSHVLISEDLLDDILHEFNTSHGLQVYEKPENKDEFNYIIDHKEICEKIEQLLN